MFTLRWSDDLPLAVMRSGLFSAAGAALAGTGCLVVAITVTLFGPAAIPDAQLVLLACLAATAAFAVWNLPRRVIKAPAWFGVGLGAVATVLAGPALAG